MPLQRPDYHIQLGYLQRRVCHFSRHRSALLPSSHVMYSQESSSNSHAYSWLASAAFSAANFASIFLRAARIISSLLRCSDACRSSRLVLQPLPFLSSEVPPLEFFESSSAVPSLPPRLYLVIKSGCAGFCGCRAVAVVDAPVAACPGGGGGWKVTGG